MEQSQVQLEIDGHFKALEAAPTNTAELPHCSERVRKVALAGWTAPYALELPAFAWPGGYPMYYTATNQRDWVVICAECANKAARDGDDGFRVTSAAVNWEELSYCDACGKPIPAAYADDTDNPATD